MRCFTVARINNNKSNFSADCEKSYVRCTFSVRTVFELLLLNCFRSLKDHSTLLLYYSHVISMYGDLCWNMICLFIEGLDTIDTSSKTGKRWNLFSSSQHRKRCVLAGTVYTKIWPIHQIDITNTFIHYIQGVIGTHSLACITFWSSIFAAKTCTFNLMVIHTL